MFKQSGRISRHLGLLAMMADAKMIIGHTRWATHGSHTQNINNHPHSADGGWIVHNGVLGNHEQLIREYDLNPVSSCDTEVLGLMIEQADGTMLERCKSAALAQSGPLVLCGLWTRPNRLVLVRSGNPLSISKHDGDRYYFASSDVALTGTTKKMPDHSAMEFGPGRVAKAIHRIDGKKATAPGRRYSRAGVNSRGYCPALPF
jgi:glucosamine 6-phosphate synthetase-like amidotransferase/phosphosugar isomerase protein